MSASGPCRAVIATSDLDAELRSFTAEVGTGRGLQLALDRSPSFFEALEVEGECPVVIAFVVEDPSSGAHRVVGTGLATRKRVHLDGSSECTWIGQLGSARIAPSHRSGLLVARCFRLLREQHRDGPVRLFLTTILEDNIVARAVFESGRAGLPTYRDQGRLLTLSYAVGPRATGSWNAMASRDVVVTPGSESDLRELVDFWREHGRRRQFFPDYRAEHLAGERGLLRGLSPADVLVARARDGGEVVGTLGLWDQGAFRRWVVTRYPRALALARGPLNLAAALLGGLPLPRPGTAVDQRLAAAPCVAGDDPGVLATLLREAWAALARGGGAWLSLALHERDPLLSLAREPSHRELLSRLYLVYWPEHSDAADALDPSLVPYVELGAL